ncbi:hypothetical protein KM043_008139 [Ampulex compressa]|nr:hypothetical protein KM043_008139 [Ampulex compressa]
MTLSYSLAKTRTLVPWVQGPALSLGRTSNPCPCKAKEMERIRAKGVQRGQRSFCLPYASVHPGSATILVFSCLRCSRIRGEKGNNNDSVLASSVRAAAKARGEAQWRRGKYRERSGVRETKAEDNERRGRTKVMDARREELRILMARRTLRNSRTKFKGASR